MSFSIGSQVRGSVVFKANGTDADPTTVVCLVKMANGTTVRYVYPTNAEIVKDSTGHYHCNVVLTAVPGPWSFRWEGAGALIAADDIEFDVLPSRFY